MEEDSCSDNPIIISKLIPLMVSQLTNTEKDSCHNSCFKSQQLGWTLCSELISPNLRPFPMVV